MPPTAPARTACIECDLIVEIGPLEEGERAACPRCGHVLTVRVPNGPTRSLSYAIAAVVLLMLANAFPFLELEAKGLERVMTLPRTAKKKSFDRLFDNIWLLVKGLLIKEPEKGLFYRSLRRALNRTRWTNADIAVFDRACKQTRWFVTHKNKEDFVDEYDPRVKK